MIAPHRERAVALALLAGLLCLTVLSAEPVAEKTRAERLKAELLALAKRRDEGKVITDKEYADFARRYDDLEEVSAIYRPARRGGVGLELILQKLGFRKPMPIERAALPRLAALNFVLARLTAEYKPTIGGPQQRRRWAAYSRESLTAAEGLEKAVKGKDPRALRKAAERVFESCANCHAVYAR